MKFGAMIYQSTGTMSAVEFARIAEQSGCDSVWLGEHTHRPVTDDERALLKQGNLHNHAFMQDPWVTLGAIAASTTSLTLGTAVTLLTQRDPIILSKEVATLDNLSGGRVILGVGFGHPVEPYRTEMLNHGTKPSERFDVVRERVLAMREMWTIEESEFHGRHVNFDPIWLFPKPIQSGARQCYLDPVVVRHGRHGKKSLLGYWSTVMVGCRDLPNLTWPTESTNCSLRRAAAAGRRTM
jgi:alkanesulfonate monooxygenase SsuD/methylene tetrahydromethanopterin reductase-like flavin-dependent oxidoreductase (luciferase family)